MNACSPHAAKRDAFGNHPGTESPRGAPGDSAIEDQPHNPPIQWFVSLLLDYATRPSVYAVSNMDPSEDDMPWLGSFAFQLLRLRPDLGAAEAMRVALSEFAKDSRRDPAKVAEIYAKGLAQAPDARSGSDAASSG